MMNSPLLRSSKESPHLTMEDDTWEMCMGLIWKRHMSFPLSPDYVELNRAASHKAEESGKHILAFQTHA